MRGMTMKKVTSEALKSQLGKFVTRKIDLLNKN